MAVNITVLRHTYDVMTIQCRYDFCHLKLTPSVDISTNSPREGHEPPTALIALNDLFVMPQHSDFTSLINFIKRKKKWLTRFIVIKEIISIDVIFDINDGAFM